MEKVVKNKFGFYSAKDMPTANELSEYYEKRYFQESAGLYRSEYNQDELVYFDNKAKVAEYICQKSIGSLLDVGCGEGYFAKYFKEKNWDIKTLDYSSHGISNHNPELLETHITGDVSKLLEDITNKEIKYDLINLSNVLEHVIDPISLLKSLKKLMHKNSYLRISVPNDFSNFQNFLLEKDYTKNTWVCLPDHLHYFTFETLKFFLHSLDFNCDILLGEFPIEIFIANEKSNYVKDREAGVYAHKSRVEVDNFLFSQGIEKYINYYEANAKIGFGRQIIAYVKL